jgi:tRNA pseudouridine38-40 synthase
MHLRILVSAFLFSGNEYLSAMRYFAELAYRGTNYHGWQKQKNAPSVQETIQQAFSTIIGVEEVVGCGRTDTGVHASQYYMHFDFEGEFPEGFLRRVNKFLDADIVIKRIFEVSNEAHARFDAVERSYTYYITRNKDPFRYDLAWHYPFFDKLNLAKLSEVADLLQQYTEFAPFCKTNSDAKTMKCELSRAEWVLSGDGNELSFHISANRFLRGMVRLIVGACINAGIGMVGVEEIQKALDEQSPLKKSWSVPAHGLFLCDVKYSFI